ncbi:MAG: hypothetical protein HY907_23080 [Deltaproteobacteria bacterium]|nr:hypothetical protein [Deltaproteobacteria bacterium]
MIRALCTVALAATAGCLFDWNDDPPPEPPPPDRIAPNATLDVPRFPPLGPDSALALTATDNVELAEARYSFRNTGTMSLSGVEDSVELTGAMLGEGFGTLLVSVEDDAGNATGTSVTGMLVDLSPPVVHPVTVLLRPGDEFAAWVADAWMLGSVEVELAGAAIVQDFPDAYPGTLGEAWDYSLVRIVTGALADGRYEARLRVRDAAGNETVKRIGVDVDATPPRVEILEPAPGGVPAGWFPVRLRAIDTRDESVWVELRLGGAPAATARGPEARLELYAGDFSPGELVLEAVAFDEAGNLSEPAVVPLFLER